MIRALTAADLTAFRALWERGLREEPTSFLLKLEEACAIPDDALRGGLEAGRHLGAFEAAQLVGIASLKRGGVARLSHMADLGPIYVAPEARRRGHARGLVEAAVDWGRAQGLLQLELAVDAANGPAIALYEDCGFERFGCRPRSVIVDGTARDDLMMLKFLDS